MGLNIRKSRDITSNNYTGIIDSRYLIYYIDCKGCLLMGLSFAGHQRGNMRLILVIIGLLALCLPAMCTDPMLNDVAFDKTITVDYKGEALSDIVKVLSKQTEVSIRTTSDIADQKVTILVDNMPVKDVMSGIATLFGLKWTVKTDDDKRIYLLYDPLRKEKDEIRQKALTDAWKKLDTKLVQLASDNRKVNIETSALMLYRTLFPKAKKEFLAGNQICFSSASLTPEWLLRPDIVEAIVAATSRYVHNDEDSSQSQLYKSPDKCNISLYTAVSDSKIDAQAAVAVHKMHDARYAGSSITFPILYTQKIEYPSDMYKDILPHEPVGDLLSKKVTIGKAELAGVDNSEAGECSATRTDLLTAIHNKLGLQIISDYYSSWGAFSGINDATLKQILDGDTLGFPAYWGWDGKVLFSRVKDVSKADQREIPNRFLRPWQAAVKRQGYPGLDELAEMAWLSNEQKQALCEDSERLGLGKYEKNVQETDAALRFYALLTSKQRRDIFEEPISPIELTAEQKNALSAMVNSVNRFSTADRVGVYDKDGFSLDNPGLACDASGSPIASIRFSTNGLAMYSYKDSENNNCSITASSYEDAVEALKQMTPPVNLDTLVPNNNINIRWTLKYQNMSESQGQITIKVANKKPPTKRIKYKSS